ncbi:MFS transporter [Tepidibacillus infernus]
MASIKSLLSPYRGLPKEIYIIFVARIINALGSFVMPLLTIILTDKIGLSKETAGLYISLSGLFFMPASLLGGKLADTIGRKKVILFFDSFAIILYIVAGLTEPSMTMVYILMFAGLAMFTAGPAHDSLIADLTTPENRSGAFALSYMGWNIGFAVGPVLGGILYKNHLPWVFIGDAFTALISLSLILFFIKETIGKTKEEITDEKRSLEKREEGSIFAVLAKRPILIYFSIFAFGYNFAYSQWSFLMPMQMMENFAERGAQYFGLVSGFNGLIVMLFTPFVTKISEHMKVIRRIVYGGILYAFGFGMLSMLNTLVFFFVSAFIFTLGEIILSISVTPFIVNHTPASHRGRMNAVLPMIMGLGHTLGPLGMGTLLKTFTIENGWVLVGIVAGISSFFMLWLEKYDHRMA